MNAVITQNLEISKKVQESSNKFTGHIGEFLAKARQSKQLDIKAVAQKLRLSVDTIKSLEQDQFDKIRAVFIHGYIKKYVKLLEINEDELPPLPNREETFQPPSSSTYELQHEIHSNNLIVKIVTWLIVLGSLSLFGLWWQGQLEWEDQVGIVPFSSTVESPLIESKNHVNNTALITETTTSIPKISERSLPDNKPAPVETVPIVPQLITPSSTQPILPVETSPTPPASPSIPTTIQTGQAVAGGIELATPTETVTTPTATPPIVDTTSQHKIVLKILGTSTVEVIDATEKFKLSGKMRKGEEHTFAGKPPYKITLEKASAIKLTIDGKPFKIKSRSRKANFTLDPDKLEP